MTTSEATDGIGEVLQVRKIGDSLGFILRLQEGDKLHVVEQTERGLKLSRYDPTHARGLEIARQAFRDYAETFKALAK